QRRLVVGAAVALLVMVVLGLGTQLEREFFPEVDAGAFEIYVRAEPGTSIDETERRIGQVEKFIKKEIQGDLEMTISEIGVAADWSAAYTPNSGPMDAVVKVQLKHDRERSAQEWVRTLREGFQKSSTFSGLEFAFDAGGMIRSAMNEGKLTTINVRITGKNQEKAHELSEAIQREAVKVPGVVDGRMLQRLNYRNYIVDVDQTKAVTIGLR